MFLFFHFFFLHFFFFCRCPYSPVFSVLGSTNRIVGNSSESRVSARAARRRVKENFCSPNRIARTRRTAERARAAEFRKISPRKGTRLRMGLDEKKKKFYKKNAKRYCPTKGRSADRAVLPAILLRRRRLSGESDACPSTGRSMGLFLYFSY